MKASHIQIQDMSSKLRKAFQRKEPDIGGNNFFTGEYDRGTGDIGLNTSSPKDWALFWEQVLKEKPPGPLPRGTLAVMMATHSAGDPVEFEPESIFRMSGATSVNWKRIHTAAPDGKSRYAVLLIPQGRDFQYYKDIFPAGNQPAAKAEIPTLKPAAPSK
jgi:hypothetical protein